MKTKPALLMAVLLITAFSTTTSFAQSLDLDEASGCLVTNVTGKVTYHEKGAPAPRTVTAGSVIPDDATVVFGKKANMTLACDDRSLVVTKKGTHQMETLSREVQAKGEVSKFAAMAFKAKGYVRDDTTKIKKGWGGKDSILFKIPAVGKIPLQPITFAWTSLKIGSNYKLIVYQNSKDAPILTAITTLASFSFDPSQLAVNIGKPCFAQVILANDDKTVSKVVSFTFESLTEANNALAKLSLGQDYIKGSNLQKTLMEAVELESKAFNTMASERYMKALQMDAKNPLTGQMYAAFLERANK
jgi:hypothetical protein